jgi:hypothetical protein
MEHVCHVKLHKMAPQRTSPSDRIPGHGEEGVRDDLLNYPPKREPSGCRHVRSGVKECQLANYSDSWKPFKFLVG